jgi:DNA-binding protein Fis
MKLYRMRPPKKTYLESQGGGGWSCGLPMGRGGRRFLPEANMCAILYLLGGNTRRFETHVSNKRFTLEQYADALRQAGGNRTAAAAILGCPCATVHSIVRAHPELKALCVPRLPGGGLRYRPDQVADALRQAGGNQNQAARLLGCWKHTVEAYVKRYPEVKAALDACRPRLKSPEQIIDALRQAGGNRGQAAQLLGWARCTLFKYIKRYPAVQEVCVALDQARRKGPPPSVGRTYARRYSPEKVIEALRQAGSIKAEAARILHCTRATVDAYIKRYPEVRGAWIEDRETLVDAAEAKLIAAVEREEWRAIRFILLTLGKDRGFTMRSTPTPAESAAKCERCRAQFEADLRKVYGDEEEEDD